MAEISKKSPEMNNHLEDLSLRLFGRSRAASIKTDTCVTCGREAKEFKDELSKKEYSISGICQKCQDGIFDS